MDDDIRALVHRERSQLGTLLRQLDDTQWASPSLCDGWTIREVVGHLVVAMTADLRRVGLATLKAWGRFDRGMDAEARREAAHPIEELLARYDTAAEIFNPPPILGSRSPLTDIVIHTQDICVPTGLTGTPEADSVRHGLDFLTRPLAARSFGATLPSNTTLVAEDLDWTTTFGNGATQIAGPGLAILLSISGRTALDDQLTTTR